MPKKIEYFSSRFGLIAAMLGMAIGTGNIWRFPRVAATHGGGSFLIPWVIFLFLWAVPLILIEFGMGKKTRAGPIGGFIRLAGKRSAWMGAWVAWTTSAIMFYYAVVTGWSLRYLLASVTGEVYGAEPGALWSSFSFTASALWYEAIAFAITIFVVAKGVRGIELASKILIPSLFVLLIILAIRAVTLPGAERGLEFLFTADLADLADYRVWLAALTQNAWSTGAGWGMITVYAIYMRQNQDTVLSSFTLAIGNNIAGLLAGVVVLCTVFSLLPDAASQIVGAGNTGLTFIWIPELFDHMPGGRYFMILFFIALAFAAWTSLISMVEMATRVLTDAGMTRRVALGVVAVVGFVLGIPSAFSEKFFLNQDFIWGVGLMISGLFFAIAAIRYGLGRFRERLINTPYADFRVGRWWDWAIRLALVEAAVLVIWWFWQSGGIREALGGNWEALFGTYGVGWAVVEWGAVLVVFLAINSWLARCGDRGAGEPDPEVEAEEASSAP